MTDDIELRKATIEDARRLAWPPVWRDDASAAQYRFLLRATLDEIDRLREKIGRLTTLTGWSDEHGH